MRELKIYRVHGYGYIIKNEKFNVRNLRFREVVKLFDRPYDWKWLFIETVFFEKTYVVAEISLLRKKSPFYQRL
ncbi:hypothetical protein DW952_18500 [Ruminococcus sp. AM44-9AT]|jgi:hypothetical protein|nr:hypothetical protein DW952_18500 [Ruminococcus sp. AM44-9AT]